MEVTQPGIRSGRIVGVLAFGGIVAALMQTLVVPILGKLPSILDTSPSNSSWVVTVTLLTAAVGTPIAGRLGDQYGKRRMLLASTVPLVVGSVIAALATNLPMMIIGRGLQGLGAGLVPLGISILRDLLPAERLSTSIALMSASLGIGGALGLPFAAAVAEYGSWRVLFWVSAALSAVVALLIRIAVPDTTQRADGRTGKGFDYVGAVGLSAGLVALLLAVSKGADWGWGSRTTLGLFTAAAAALLLWGRWELRCADPMVDLRTTSRPQVLLTNAASVVVGFSMYSSALIVPQLLQMPEETGYGLGQSMLAAGLLMAPGGLAMMFVAPLGGKLTTKSGPKVTLLVGTLVMAAGYALSLVMMGNAWTLMIVTIVINGGVGFAYGAMPALIMGGVPQSETAAANSFNTVMRSVGTSVASAVVGLVLSQMTVRLGPAVIPSEDAFRTGMIIGGGVALAAALITLAIPYRKPAPAAVEQSEGDAGAALQRTDAKASPERT